MEKGESEGSGSILQSLTLSIESNSELEYITYHHTLDRNIRGIIAST